MRYRGVIHTVNAQPSSSRVKEDLSQDFESCSHLEQTEMRRSTLWGVRAAVRVDQAGAEALDDASLEPQEDTRLSGWAAYAENDTRQV